MKKIIKRLILIAGVGYILLCTLLYFAQDYLILHPEYLSQDTQYNFNDASFEEVNIAAHDDIKINGLLFSTAEKSKGIVIYHHGNTGSVQGCGWHFKDFTSRGYDFLIWDYRTYGKTPGPRTENNFYSDALSVYDWANEKYQENNIVLYGQSLGTGFATYSAAKRNPRLLILEAPYFSIADLALRSYPFIPEFLLKYPLRSHEHIDDVKCPIVGFHGTKDQVIYWQSSEKLAKLNPNYEFIKLKGVSHNGIPNADGFKSKLDLLLNL